jgi:hypothetical protein
MASAALRNPRYWRSEGSARQSASRFASVVLRSINPLDLEEFVMSIESPRERRPPSPTQIAVTIVIGTVSAVLADLIMRFL